MRRWRDRGKAWPGSGSEPVSMVLAQGGLKVWLLWR